MSYNRLGANSPTIPLHLQSLFESMNFLGSAVKDGKPCFNSRHYVDRNSYWGGFRRWLSGEKQSRYGNDKIRTVVNRHVKPSKPIKIVSMDQY